MKPTPIHRQTLQGLLQLALLLALMGAYGATVSAAEKTPSDVQENDAGDEDYAVVGDGWRFFLGMAPGSHRAGRVVSGTGFGNPKTVDSADPTKTVNKLAGGLSSFAGAKFIHYKVAPNHVLRLNGEINLALNVGVDAAIKKNGNSHALFMSGNAITAEYLYYLLPAQSGSAAVVSRSLLNKDTGQGVFVGSWANIPSVDAQFIKAAGATKSYSNLSAPVLVSVGAGVGQVYPIGLRIQMKMLEKTLTTAGIISKPIPSDIAQYILKRWFKQRDSLPQEGFSPNPNAGNGSSHHQQLLIALEVLGEMKIITESIDPWTSYQLEKILLDTHTIDRWVGWDVRLGIRARKDLSFGKDSTGTKLPTYPTAFAGELHGRFHYNLSLNSELRFLPTVAVAPREKDIVLNQALGAMRSALSTMPAVGLAIAFVPFGRVVLDLPATYTHYKYDAGHNLSGIVNAFTAISAGYWRKETTSQVFDPITFLTSPVTKTEDKVIASLSFGGSYTFFLDSSTGYTLGAAGGLGQGPEGFTYGFNLVAAVDFGTGNDYYTAPDQVGDTVPFDHSWLPLSVPSANSSRSSFTNANNIAKNDTKEIL